MCNNLLIKEICHLRYGSFDGQALKKFLRKNDNEYLKEENNVEKSSG